MMLLSVRCSTVIIDLLDDRQGVTRYMSSGSSAHDGDGWSSAQYPYRDDAMSGPGPYGPGRRSEPREVPGGRREVPFGPDVSWPNGFQQLDQESRRLLESGYGRGVGGPGSRDPASDDYGDPGSSDPAYDGPRSGSGGRGRPDGNRGSRAPAGSPAPPRP